jgi:hypothetical protein
MAQLIKPIIVRKGAHGRITLAPVIASQDEGDIARDDDVTDQIGYLENLPDDLRALWKTSQDEDRTYTQMVTMIRNGQRLFPSSLGVRVSMSEYSLLASGALLFRGRYWVPDSDELRTKLIQVTHDSMICGHPGREGTMAILMRQFFWPGMAQSVRRFVRNYDSCGRNKAWRDRRQGFLKPLLIPDRL